MKNMQKLSTKKSKLSIQGKGCKKKKIIIIIKKNKKIVEENSDILQGSSNFSSQNVLNKDLILDINKTKEEQIMGGIIEPKDNNKFI